MFQNFFCNGTSCYPGDGLPAGGTPASPIVAKAIFYIVDQICMAWPINFFDLAIIPRRWSVLKIIMDIGVPGYRGTGSFTLKYAG